MPQNAPGCPNGEFRAPTSTSDRQCNTLTVYDPASRFRTLAPTDTRDRDSKALTACYAALRLPNLPDFDRMYRRAVRIMRAHKYQRPQMPDLDRY